MKNLFRDKIPLTRRRIEILNYRYDKAVPIAEHIDRINRFASDFERTKLTDENFRVLLLLQSLCFTRDDLKLMALRIVEKNQDATIKDIATELEAHMNVSANMKTLENPTNISGPTTLAVRAKFKNKKRFPRKIAIQPVNRKVHLSIRLSLSSATVVVMHIFFQSVLSAKQFVTSVPKKGTSLKCVAHMPRSITFWSIIRIKQIIRQSNR